MSNVPLVFNHLSFLRWSIYLSRLSSHSAFSVLHSLISPWGPWGLSPASCFNRWTYREQRNLILVTLMVIVHYSERMLIKISKLFQSLEEIRHKLSGILSPENLSSLRNDVWQHIKYKRQGKLTIALCPEFLLGFSHIGLTDLNYPDSSPLKQK